MPFRPALMLAAALALGATAAHAAPRTDRGHSVAISASPLHLLLPLFEVQAEIYAGEALSFAAIVGYGQVTVEVDGNDPLTLSVLEIGGQGRGYFYGSSEEGAFGGVELIYTSVDGSLDGVTGLASGVAVGPIIGYKWVWDNFFIDLNGGASYVLAQAEASDGEESASASESGVVANLNFNLGAAF